LFGKVKHFFAISTLLVAICAFAQPLLPMPSAVEMEPSEPEPPATFLRAPSWPPIPWATGYRLGVSNVSTNMIGSRAATATNGMLPVVVGDNTVTWSATNATTTVTVVTNWPFAEEHYIKMSMGAAGWMAATNANGVLRSTNVNVMNELRRIWENVITNETPLVFAIPKASVTLGWGDSDGGNTYKLYYGTASRAYSGFKPSTSTSATLTNLDRGREYFFAVTAVNSVGQESAYSNEVTYRP
jgi:hypothetical protein